MINRVTNPANHFNNNYIEIIDGKKQKVFIKKLPNDTEEILKTLSPLYRTKYFVDY